MSDYINKSELVEDLKKHFDALYREDGTLLQSDNICISEDVEDLIKFINEQPTFSETEILRKPFERVVERLEERRSINDCRKCRHFTKNGDECNEDCTDALVDDLIEIVKEEGGIE